MTIAVSIVEFHEDSQSTYAFNCQGLEAILEDVKNKKVVVVSIAGSFRRGKSFLLNFFVTYLEWLSSGGKGVWFDEQTTLDKFHFRGGKERDTNGIYLWGKPYLLEDWDGEEVAVLLMDTQGTFDPLSTVKDSATIFALSALLSSVQILNISGQIQEDDLTNLRLLTEYDRLIDGRENKATFQRLIFLVRDWPNSDENAYGFEGGQEYLDELLRTSPKQNKEQSELQQTIKSSFGHLEAFLMPHPGPKIAKNNSQKVLGDQVEEEFLDQLQIFVPSLFHGDKFEAKRIKGKKISCEELLLLFKSYMTIFNRGDLPGPLTILNATAEAVNTAAEQKARREYEDLMDKKMKEYPTLTSLATLAGIQRKAEVAGTALFESRPRLGEESQAKANMDNLQKHFQGRHGDFKKIVEQNAERERERERRERGQEERLERKRREEARIRREDEEGKRRIGEEEDRLRREREEQERRRQEEQETLRRLKDEQERRRREMEARSRREEEERQRRMRVEEERLCQEREELDRRRTRQLQAQQAARQREEQERQALQRLLEAQRSSCYQRSYSPPSSSFGGRRSPPSSSYGSGSSRRDTSRPGNTFTRHRGSSGQPASKRN